MEVVGVSIRAPLIRVAASDPTSGALDNGGRLLLRGAPPPSRRSGSGDGAWGRRKRLVVEAKGKKGMIPRQFRRPPPPSLPKIEDDGNPRFVVFIRTANVYLWYPLSLITGGTTAKIMVAVKDNFLRKYIYKDTIARNLAAVIYKDEKEIQKTAFKQYRVLRSATEFRYGYKLVVSFLSYFNGTHAVSPHKSFLGSQNNELMPTIVFAGKRKRASCTVYK